MRIPLFCLCVSALGGAAAQAQEDELALAYGDAATTSIATGTPQSLRRAPAVATVITAEDMRAMGATDLEDVLARVPGLHVSRQAGFYSPTWVVRGVFSQYNQQVLLLWNGLPLTTALRGDRGNTAWRNLPVESLARIEILRGPGSALYGAEAYAGVINLITKSGRDLQGLELGLRAERFGGRAVWLQGGQQQGDWDYKIYAQHSRSDGFEATIERDAQSSNDAAFGSQVSLAPGAMNLARQLHQLDLDLGWQRWRLRASAQQREFRSGAGIAFALDPVALQRTRRLNAELSWTEAQLAEHLAAGASLDFQAYHLRYPVPLQIFPPGTSFPTGVFPEGMRGAPETSDKRWRLQAYLLASGWQGHQWRLGAGAERSDLYRVTEGRNFRYAPNGLPIPLPGGYTQDGDLFLYPQERTHQHVYVQDEWQLAPDWQLTAGVRHDHYSDVGGSTNPRLALVWEARHNLTLKALHGRAYRAPSFAELYSFSNPVARGNPAVRPETVATTELALHWQASSRLQGVLNLFRFRMDDIIRPTPNHQPGTGTTFNNAGGQSGQGGETEWRWQALPRLQLQASYSWQRGRDLATGLAPGYAPRQRTLLGLDWRAHPDWRLGLQLLQVGERARPAGDARAPLRGYLSADLALRWSPLVQPWNLGLQVRNLGKADVREPSLAPGRIVGDLPQAPRSLGVEGSWRL